MRLKLFEAAQPITNLQYNIEKNILPEFNKYGLNFISKPVVLSKFRLMYDGVSEDLSNQLYLSTASPQIDEWNEVNSDIYVADLFAELQLNGKIEQLGPISSSNPSSIDDSMNNININEYKLPSDEELEDDKLYEPVNNNSDLTMMTKKEWIQLYNKLHNELVELEAKLQKADEENDDKTYYEIAKGPYKTKREYWDKVFIPNFPIDNI